MRSFVLGKKENIKKDSYIWNTIGGLINAFQSVIILMVLTRSLDGICWYFYYCMGYC